MTELTAERVRDLLHYEVVTGRFYWKKCARIGFQSKRAGTQVTGGYTGIKVDGTRYQAHRLAWLWVTGQWPSELIDHENGSPGCNAWHNLRDATPEQNQWNKRVHRNSTSGVKGVSWSKEREKWVAQVCVGGKNRNMGRYATFEEAVAAIQTARAKLHGEFARH
ncbi:HNH endonuclease [Caballeronia temeraria]|uniref:HNH endonuclease n=1 Tax=Caballeronia temeraria TaxID=1777137 RepID=A0A158DMA8_9BURK|nr:HNH endonuclease [Caballeronia temeraria]